MLREIWFQLDWIVRMVIISNYLALTASGPDARLFAWHDYAYAGGKRAIELHVHGY